MAETTHTAAPARVIPLPGAALAPIKQTHKTGRYPQGIGSISAAARARAKAIVTQRLAPAPATADDRLIAAALDVLQARMRETNVALLGVADAERYLRLRIGARDHEVFVVLFLDAQRMLIAAEEMFRGSITECRVYPREIARRALAWNAASVVLAHNHPSGRATASAADLELTKMIRDALDLIQVSLVDHLIVTARSAFSMASRGLLP